MYELIGYANANPSKYSTVKSDVTLVEGYEFLKALPGAYFGPDESSAYMPEFDEAEVVALVKHRSSLLPLHKQSVRICSKEFK